MSAMAMMNRLCCVLPRCGCSSTVWITRHRYPEVVDIPWGMRSPGTVSILPCFYESKWLPLGLITKLLSNGLIQYCQGVCEDGQTRDSTTEPNLQYGLRSRVKRRKRKMACMEPLTMVAVPMPMEPRTNTRSWWMD